MPVAVHHKEEIEIPTDVDVVIQKKTITVKGPKGEVKREFSYPGIKIDKVDNEIVVSGTFPTRKKYAVIGAIRSRIRNMVRGVTEGFEYKLRAVYSHFPISIHVRGNAVMIENFLGEKEPRYAKIVGDTEVEAKRNEVIVRGSDKEAVGQTAANIEQATRTKQMDPRIFQDGIYIVEKDGKPV